MSILVAVIALSLLIIIHELGHFIVAKLSDIKVLEFSLFMGPKLFSVKRGETEYSLRAIPLGGFVKMEGEEEASDDERAFNRKPILTRAAVIAAGPIMNLIAALVTIIIILSFTGYYVPRVQGVKPGSPAYSAGIRDGDMILTYGGKRILHPSDIFLFAYGTKGAPVDVKVLRDGKTEIFRLEPEIIPENRYILGFVPKADYGPGSNVVADTGREQEGPFKPGDEIRMLNDTRVSEGREIREYLKTNGGKPIKVTVLRDGQEMVIDITPQVTRGEESYGLGFGYASERGGFFSIIKNSVYYALSIARNVYYSITWLITGRISLSQLSGPVGIVTTIGDVVEQSPTFVDKIQGLLSFMAFIGINLGMVNLIPIPALDGSKLLLLAVEGIRRKAIPPEKEAFISLVGFVLLIMLMIFTTYNDILRTVRGG
ncbi:MAG TPA: RIP metalloprotease RseP [Clostridiaceae bacterium]|nr:RIP metalloprotease RseP [Clostridiaceae bacterium]